MPIVSGAALAGKDASPAAIASAPPALLMRKRRRFGALFFMTISPGLRSTHGEQISYQPGLAQHGLARGVVPLDQAPQIQPDERALLYYRAPVDHGEPCIRRRARDHPGDDVAVRAGVLDAVDAER